VRRGLLGAQRWGRARSEVVAERLSASRGVGLTCRRRSAALGPTRGGRGGEAEKGGEGER